MGIDIMVLENGKEKFRPKMIVEKIHDNGDVILDVGDR